MQLRGGYLKIASPIRAVRGRFFTLLVGLALCIGGLGSHAIAATTAVEGNSGQTVFRFTVTRTGDLSDATTVDYAVIGSGTNPADAADFGGALPSGTLEFAADEATQVITLNVQGDTDVEADEAFTVTIEGDSITNTIVTGIIRNDDTAFAITAITDTPTAEGDSTGFRFAVTRSGDLSGRARVRYAVAGSGDNAADRNDFVGRLPRGTLRFVADEEIQIITLNVNDDSDVEADEDFTVTLSRARGAAITTAQASGSIRNDDLVFTMLPDTVIVREGDSGQTAVRFTVTRTGDTAGATTADYAVTGSGNNPADADDFIGGLPSGTLRFSAGETSKVITLNLKGDTDIESDEDFTLTLFGSDGAYIATAIGTIENDDTAFTLVLKTDTVTEGDSGQTVFRFTVTRTGDLSDATTVDYAVAGSGDDAADAADFGGALPSGTLEYAADEAAQVITLNVQGDTDVEADEDFTVTLSQARGAAITIAEASGIIHNDDSAFALATDVITVREGDSGQTVVRFAVTRAGDTSVATSVPYAVTGSGDNPADADDFIGGLPSGALRFSAGETSKVITLNLKGDTDIEPDEDFTVTLEGAITTTTVMGIIDNDDTAFTIANTDIDTATEGDATPFRFTITRSGDLSAEASVDYAITGIGIDAADFESALTGKIRFIAEETEITLTLVVADDDVVEGDEAFTLTLENPLYASGSVTINTATVTALIRSNDSELAITPATITVIEGTSDITTLTFTVTRSGDLSARARVAYAVTGSGDNPADAEDFNGSVLPSDTLMFAAGDSERVITLDISGDAKVESDEGFTVTLFDPSGTRITALTATGIIRNDDTQLKENLAAVVNQHERVAAAREDVNAAKERIAVAKGGWYPTLSATADYGKERRTSSSTGNTSFNANEFDLSLTQSLWDFGATGAAVKSAIQSHAQAQATLVAVTQGLILEGIEAHVNLINARKVFEFSMISEENIRNQTKLEDARVQAGTGISTDVLQAKRQLARSQVRRVRAHELVVLAENRYRAVFLERNPVLVGKLIIPVYPPARLPASLSELIINALSGNPQLDAVLTASRAMAFDANKVKSDEFFPTFDLIASHEAKRNTGGISGLRKENSIKVQLKFDFNLGQTANNNFRASQVTAAAADDRYQAARYRVEEQARNAWQNYLSARETAEFLSIQADISEAFLVKARTERELGRRSLIDVLAGEVALIEARSDAETAKARVITTVYSMLSIMGQLNLDALDSVN